jgi:hypothetical protein
MDDQVCDASQVCGSESGAERVHREAAGVLDRNRDAAAGVRGAGGPTIRDALLERDLFALAEGGEQRGEPKIGVVAASCAI